MNTLKGIPGWIFRLLGSLAAVALVAGLALAPAYASGAADEATPPAPGHRVEALEKAYQRELAWLAIQTNHLADAATIAARVQTFIDKAKGEGKDTSALEAALSAFKSQVAVAQAAHDTAAGILATHAGFDDSGHVTDQAQAIETVRQARQSLQDAHLALRGAMADLRLAIRTWRSANR